MCFVIIIEQLFWFFAVLELWLSLLLASFYYEYLLFYY